MIKFYAFKGKSFISRLIKFWTRGPYSHIAVEVDGQLIEAWKFKDGLHWDYSSLSNHTPGTPYEVWVYDGLTPEQERYCKQFWTFLADIKAGYDFKGILGFVFKKVKDEQSKFFCSEGAIWPITKVKNWDRVRPYRVDPTRFVEIIQAAGAKLELKSKT